MNSLAIRASKLLRLSPISPLAIMVEKGSSRSWFSTGPIDEGVEEDFENPHQGFTALQVAVAENQMDMVNLLAMNGADVVGVKTNKFTQLEKLRVMEIEERGRVSIFKGHPLERRERSCNEAGKLILLPPSLDDLKKIAEEVSALKKKKSEDKTGELKLEGGFSIPKMSTKDDEAFLAPEMNAFGRQFRDYDAESERQKSVEEFYRIQHINQTVDFVKKMREEYGKLDKKVMSIWECCELLNEVVDESDPDLDEPQIQHLLQSAEAIRKDYPNQDWLHLTALIHDLGKVITLPQFGGLPQWAVVGDTFPVGCAFHESNIHHKYFLENSDFHNQAYNTKTGIYTQGCGLNNVMMSWGHDDYMYLVAKENGTTLPSAGLFIIRYHSFYPLHTAGEYTHLMNDEDKENLKWLHVFNKYDLYSKSKVHVDVEKVKPYYMSLIKKYFPENLRW